MCVEHVYQQLNYFNFHEVIFHSISGMDVTQVTECPASTKKCRWIKVWSIMGRLQEGKLIS
jgi:hypothetical protein